jgi:hypothetical protein
MVITELILVSSAVLILLPTGFLSQLPLDIFGYILVYKTVIAAIVVIIIGRNRWTERLNIVKGGGLLLGHVVGLLLGGILGGRYGGIFWGIVGIVVLYLLVGRIGAKISFAIGSQLDRLSSPTEQVDADNTIRSIRPNALLLSLYGIIVPTLFVLVAVLLNSSGVPVSEYSASLPVARIVVITLSSISIFTPWLLRTRWKMKPITNVVSQENAIFILGMGLSVVPAVYGFFLYLVFSASIVELSIFAVVSSIAVILWSANTKLRQPKVDQENPF